MPNYKVILQFQAYQDDWKEIFYLTEATPANAAARVTPSFISAALAMRAINVFISSVTVQDVAQPRSAYTINVPYGGNVTSTTLAPDVRSTTALYSLGSAGRVVTRHLFVRGLADADVTRDPLSGLSTPSGRITSGMSAYIAAMVTAGMTIQSLQPVTPGVGTYQFFDIVSITVAAGGKVTLTTEAGATLTTSNRVRLSLFDQKMWAGINGTYTAKRVQLPNFDISYKSELAPGTYPVQRGHYRAADYRYLPISSAALDSYFVRFSSRATKTGPFVGRGAKRAVRLRYR